MTKAGFICDMVSYLDGKKLLDKLASFYWMDMANENNSKQDWIRSSKTLNKGSGSITGFPVGDSRQTEQLPVHSEQILSLPEMK